MPMILNYCDRQRPSALHFVGKGKGFRGKLLSNLIGQRSQIARRSVVRGLEVRECRRLERDDG